ncbi:hypothetical protein AVEN_71937-1 [Araneus ventricosus]|uniref:Uncharacterized protein n=1 Tax=Araneus ventricosus TaxID=182803 RepID=A0A4Y2LXE3_ARAVE|nr:hypothetical protein AVEN_71937-1 [Araneus ventricosus]
MRNRQVSKRVLAYLVGIVIVLGRVTSTPMTGRTSFGRGSAVASDGYQQSELSYRLPSGSRSFKFSATPTASQGCKRALRKNAHFLNASFAYHPTKTFEKQSLEALRIETP